MVEIKCSLRFEFKNNYCSMCVDELGGTQTVRLQTKLNFIDVSYKNDTLFWIWRYENPTKMNSEDKSSSRISQTVSREANFSPFFSSGKSLLFNRRPFPSSNKRKKFKITAF